MILIIFTGFTASCMLLSLCAFYTYLQWKEQQAYFKKSQDNWNELIAAIKELGRYVE